MTYISLNDITVSYDKKNKILENLNLDIKKGELVSLLGPSGCGKTTTLRVMAGLVENNSGTFIVDQEDLTKVPVHKRNFGLVFQSYALFPHLSVYDNVAFGLKMRKVDKAMIAQKVEEMLEICGLSTFASRFPKEMSGGQRQRVALARALVVQPKLLLLDEPLSNLDAKLRIQMRTEIKRIQKKLGITTVFVTHDQEECFSISDKVAVMNNGIIEQYDSPENIYKKPVSEFVAKFIGFENFIDLVKENNYFVSNDGTKFIVENSNEDKGNYKATIRPDDIEIVQSHSENCIDGTIGVRTFLGKSYQYEVITKIGTFLVNEVTDLPRNQGDSLTLYLPTSKLILVKSSI